jgi:hypothetical protein
MAAENQNEQIDLAYRLLDLDLVDSEGRRCGKVDDLELEGGPGELTYVAAIRTGPGALPARFQPRFRDFARRLLRSGFKSVPSALVDDFDSAVTLTETAEELGLAAGDRALADWFGRPQGEEPQ